MLKDLKVGQRIVRVIPPKYSEIDGKEIFPEARQLGKIKEVEGDRVMAVFVGPDGATAPGWFYIETGESEVDHWSDHITLPKEGEVFHESAENYFRFL